MLLRLTPFAIRLTGCATGMNSAQNVKAYFEPSSNIDLATHNLKNTATPTKADNVQIQLLNSNGTSTILLGEADNGQDVQSETIGSDGSATLRYMAQYYATGQSTAGDVKATVHYTIAYEYKTFYSFVFLGRKYCPVFFWRYHAKVCAVFFYSICICSCSG